MKENQKSLQEEMALFRYGVLGELVHLPPGTKGLYGRIKEKAAIDYKIPGTSRTRVAPETIRTWLKLYRNGSFDALRPKPRRDLGKTRSLSQEVADILVSIKEEHRKFSVPLVIKAARADGRVPKEVALPPSSVHRLLSRHGLMKKEVPPVSKDHRRFTFEKAGDMWMSDVMHGPSVYVDGKRKHKTYLIAFIDDASRIITHAEFALSENTQSLLPVLKKATMRRGIARRLYVDNGSAFRSKQLELVCAKLGTTLIHAKAYHPQAKGKVERWFRTVRMQLLPVLTAEDTKSLQALNRRLWAYVEGEYHRAPHSGLDNQTPTERWAQVADEVQYPEPGLDLDDLFLWEAVRKVKKDRTVSLHGAVYEVDAMLVDATVQLRYDPSRKGSPVQVWHEGKKVQTAKLVDTHANCFVKREHDRSLCFAEMHSIETTKALRAKKGVR